MSYEIVKGIKIEDNKVFINSASNNVWPRDYEYRECGFFSKILTEQGQEALDIELLREYESGNLQGGTNKYTRALKVLRNVLEEEYKLFDWRIGNHEEYVKAEERRKTPEFKELLKKALNTKMPKGSFIISKPYGLKRIYARKVTSRHIFWTDIKSEAKTFNFQREAEIVISGYSVEGIEVEDLNKKELENGKDKQTDLLRNL